MPRAGRTAAGTHAAACVIAIAALCAAPAAARQTPQPRIAGGTVNTSVPAVVRLDVLHDQSKGMYISERCSGALIAPGAVLTAAHCFTAALAAGTTYVVRVSFPAAAVDETFACAAVIHPQFQGAGSGAFDYALIFLPAPVTGVTPVSIDASGAGESQGANALGIGFGSTAFNPLGSDSPQGLAVTVQPPQACSLSTTAAVQQICVASSSTSTAFMCHGDSGGPLLTWPAGSASPVLSGVISQATGVVSNCVLGQATSLTTCGRASAISTWVSGQLAAPPSAAALTACNAYLDANNYFRSAYSSAQLVTVAAIIGIVIAGTVALAFAIAVRIVHRRRAALEALGKIAPATTEQAGGVGYGDAFRSFFAGSAPAPSQIPPTVVDEQPPSWQRPRPAAAWAPAEEPQMPAWQQPERAPRSLPALGRRVRVRRLRRDGLAPDDPAAAAYPGARGVVVGYDPHGRALVAVQLDDPAGEIIWIGVRWIKGMDEDDA